MQCNGFPKNVCNLKQRAHPYILVSLSAGLSFSYSFSWQMSWYGFLSTSSTTELPTSGSLFCNSWRDRCSTIPAPIESPRTLVVVRNRSLRKDTEQVSTGHREWKEKTRCHKMREDETRQGKREHKKTKRDKSIKY